MPCFADNFPSISNKCALYIYVDRSTTRMKRTCYNLLRTLETIFQGNLRNPVCHHLKTCLTYCRNAVNYYYFSYNMSYWCILYWESKQRQTEHAFEGRRSEQQLKAERLFLFRELTFWSARFFAMVVVGY